MLLPMGACAANSMHSEITAGSTGRSRSSRLRTARVVIRTWSKSCKDMWAPNLLERSTLKYSPPALLLEQPPMSAGASLGQPNRNVGHLEVGMGTVRVDMSMSLNGFVAAPNTDAQDPRDTAVIAEVRDSVGAVVLGRTTFDVGVDIWGDVPWSPATKESSAMP